ncbi:hypothetical protein KBZ19_12645 [Synechococcus sp. L2F]|nr:hypothetical protein [Synechococcus sp. L2F]
MIRWLLIGAAAVIAGWGNGFSEAMAQAQRPPTATVLSISVVDTLCLCGGLTQLRTSAMAASL